MTRTMPPGAPAERETVGIERTRRHQSPSATNLPRRTPDEMIQTAYVCRRLVCYADPRTPTQGDTTTMPRKDGTPTAAERKNAERIEANRQHIAKLPDHELAMLAADDFNMGDPDIAAMVAAEQDRRNLA